MHLPEREPLRVDLRVVHREGQRQIVLAVAVKTFLDVRIDGAFKG